MKFVNRRIQASRATIVSGRAIDPVEAGKEMDKKIERAKSRALALASLYICESLLLELESRNLVRATDVQGLLRDAAKALAALGEADREDFITASELIEAIRERHETLPDVGATS